MRQDLLGILVKVGLVRLEQERIGFNRHVARQVADRSGLIHRSGCNPELAVSNGRLRQGENSHTRYQGQPFHLVTTLGPLYVVSVPSGEPPLAGSNAELPQMMVHVPVPPR
jgi:hypothetical protein